MVLMLDNYDSFTYNLIQYLKELGQDVCVKENDAITVEAVIELNPDHIIISPGPGRPENAGITLPLIKAVAGRIPLLGVCLGHQAIAQAFGGNVILAPDIMHGKTSQIYHQQTGLFAGLPMPFTATRYHSLIVERDSLPEDFEVTAWVESTAGEPQEIMAIQHKTQALYGVQFHPESILTEGGHQMLKQFLAV